MTEETSQTEQDLKVLIDMKTKRISASTMLKDCNASSLIDGELRIIKLELAGSLEELLNAKKSHLQFYAEQRVRSKSHSSYQTSASVPDNGEADSLAFMLDQIIELSSDMERIKKQIASLSNDTKESEQDILNGTTEQDTSVMGESSVAKHCKKKKKLVNSEGDIEVC